MPYKPMLVTVLVLVLALPLAACASNPAPGPDRPVSSSPSEPDEPATEPAPPLGGMMARPGLYDADGDTKRALGTLEYRDLEGGFWAVVDRMPGQEIADARVIAVIVNAEALDAKRLDGRLVAATGPMLEGSSIRMAGPEMEADSLEEVATDSDAPAQ